MSEDKKIEKTMIDNSKVSEKELSSQPEKKVTPKNDTDTSTDKVKENLIAKSSDKETLGNEQNDSKKSESKNIEKNQIKSKTLTAQTKNEDSKSKKNNESEKKTSGFKQNLNDVGVKNSDQNEFIEKLVSINRVAKVVKGGRRFSFAALVVVGDGNGMVGHGKGKAKEVPEAIKKATDEAKSKMIRVPLRQGRTLHHDIKGRFDSGNVYLRTAPSGTGVIAGGPMRAVFEALGIQDIVAKSVGTSNPHNMVRATFEALKSASSPKIIAMRRGLKINDITKRRKNNTGIENAKN